MSPTADRPTKKAPPADPATTLALLWGPQDRPGRSGLTVRAIVRAAIELADAGGVDALSMRGVAERVGAGAMSLYTHVPSKPALIELMIDTVNGELYADLDEPARQGDWRAGLRFVADRNWQLFARHPWLLQIPQGRPVLGPNINRKYEAELRPLDGIGLSDLEMDGVLTMVLVHVAGLARWQGALQADRDGTGEDDQQWWAAIEPALAAVMDPAAFPVGGRVGRAVGEHLASVGDPAGSLDFGLDRIVDGVERILERKPRPDMAP
ncbi:TetR/AcrR family transcriptional regulator [Nakamurella multipartita]|jgi:AcrR family transcriptional regulator|uniref:Transcriptional regulator, TetR family n=1 Tax=Nakamurella multipartita (strain ATCC 700099 / DSM 44233 / CIP 104796 / JCM 9543 / NBRC 105858 / Y-104) TaxID=479431 RepID=C8XAE3_NAKMY|nr:TetR/AcrR family transcriptional regulator [Nakamurella multipartita]ACV77308.1 transcriptional regulator, TetR family [Nakamurella multipartita DSM 44233]HOZ58967.1 TetR/AcrR family transcriptional regulator [Nakamurella multipartita]